MKLVLEFTTNKNIFPIEYRKVFIHFLKNCLNSANDGKYYDSYYAEAQRKNFNFAVFLDKPRFGDKVIELETNKIKMIFSTSEQLTGFIFYSSFLERKNTKIMLENDNFMTLKSVSKISEEIIQNNKIIVKMNSPLVIRNHNKENNKDYYYSFVNELFETEALKVIKHQLSKEGFGEQYIKDFKILPIKCNKVIVKHYNCKIEASIGNFLVEGDPTVLTYLMQAGTGSRKSEGFGMMELLTQDV